MSPPVIGNATAIFNATRRSITINCLTGYRFGSGVHQGYVSATVHCNDDNTWAAISPCTSMTIFHFVIKLYKSTDKNEKSLVYSLHNMSSIQLILAISRTVEKQVQILLIIIDT